MVMANYGSEVYSDRSGWCWDGMECGSQRGGGSAKQPMLKGDTVTSSVILLGFDAADMEQDALPQRMAWARVMVWHGPQLIRSNGEKCFNTHKNMS